MELQGGNTLYVEVENNRFRIVSKSGTETVIGFNEIERYAFFFVGGLSKGELWINNFQIAYKQKELENARKIDAFIQSNDTIQASLSEFKAKQEAKEAEKIQPPQKQAFITKEEVLAIKERHAQREAKLVFDLVGKRGRSIKIYPDKCVINVEPTSGAILTGNATDGEKTIYYVDCVGLQYKQPGATLGYLQFETSSGLMNEKSSNFFNENTFTYDNTTVSPELMEIVVLYVKDRLDSIKSRKAETFNN